MNADKIRWLYCACCGAHVKGRQWPNQDTGYGLCGDCGDRIPQRHADYTPEEMERVYGRRGYHYGENLS